MPGPFKDSFTSAAPPSKAAPFSREETHSHIALDAIIDDGRNPRLGSKADAGKFDSLVRSVKTDGVQSPVKVFLHQNGGGKEYHLVYGNRRVAAAREAGLAEIPALVMDHAPDAIERERLRAVENLERQDLNPAEEALLVLQLVETMGGDKDQAAQQLGRPLAWINDRFYLQRLCKGVREMLAAGTVSLGHAREIAKLGDPRDQVDIADQVKVTGKKYERVYSIDEVQAMVENQKRSLRVVPWKLEEAFAGKPACHTCPDNSRSDLVLFATGKEEAEKGCCLNTACFEAKARAATNAQQVAVAKVGKQLKAKTIDKAGAAGAARDAAPPWIKADSVVRAATRDLHLGDAKRQTPNAKDKQAKTPANPYQKPLLAYTQAYRKWTTDLERAIAKEAAKSAASKAMALLLRHSQAIDDSYDLPGSDYDFENNYDKKRRNAKAPYPEKPVGPQAAGLLNPDRCTTYDGLLALAATASSDDCRVGLHASGPDLASRIARAFGLTPAPPPAFEDFLPKELKKEGTEALRHKGTEGKEAGKKPHPADKAGPGTCWKCGCTEDEPCESGCSWANADQTLCSHCVSLAGISGTKPFDCKTVGLTPEELAAGDSSDTLKSGDIKSVLWFYREIPFACVGFSGVPAVGTGPRTYRLMRLVPADRWTRDSFTAQSLKVKGLPEDLTGLVVFSADVDSSFVLNGEVIQVIAPAVTVKKTAAAKRQEKRGIPSVDVQQAAQRALNKLRGKS